jgi:hypothetical protein
MGFRDYSVGVNLIGRDISASKALNKLGWVAKSTGDKLESASKKANYVLGAMTGAAVLFAKAAAEDERSSIKLAATLKTVANAGDTQIAAVEKFINKASIWSATADDDIRPAFDRLVRSTKNVGEAQKLTTLALEIAKQKGLPVVQVANALAKAHDGNVGALKKLGIAVKSAGKSQDVYATKMKVVNGQLTSVQVKVGKTGKDMVKFDDIIKQVGKDFKGSIAAQAETAAFKFEKFKIVLGETQETLGYMLLPYLNDLSDWLVKIAPFVEKHKEAIKKWAIAIVSVAIAVKTVNAAYKTFMALQGIGAIVKLIAIWAGFGTTVATAGTEMAAAGVAVDVAWAPFLITVATIAAAFVGINLVLNKMAKNRKALLTDPNKIPSWSTESNKLDFLSGRPTFMSAAPHAAGGIFNKAHIGIVAEKGPEAIVPLSKMGMFGGVTVINHIQGSVVAEKDLALKIRNDIAQLMRRKGLNPAILGV